MSSLAESERLHQRVRAFARASLERAPEAAAFDTLASEIARYQAKYVPGFQRLVEAHGSTLADAASIPAVPVEAFRLARVAAHPPELDAVCFATSGTTGTPGLHAMRTTETYRAVSLAWAVPALTGARPGRFVVVALAPHPGPAVTSSLSFMMRALMETLDGRSLRSASAADFESDESARWLFGPEGADVAGLARAVGIAKERKEPLLLLGTSFAFAMLCDAHPACFDAPPGSFAMTTGGFKGKVREVAPDVLAGRIASLLGVPPWHVVGEYGMTELTSQLYERPRTTGRGTYHPPPWLRVTPVDPETLAPVADGEVGLARFVDLGNVDSAVALVTQDQVRLSGGAVELLGRRPGAPPRGCSLSIEEMVLGAGKP